jgi:hypothetical protein
MVPLCQAAGLSVAADEIAGWLKVESVFQAEACGRPCYEIPLTAVTNRYRSFSSEIASLTRETARLSGAIAAQHDAMLKLGREAAEQEQQSGEALRVSSQREQELVVVAANARQELINRDIQLHIKDLEVQHARKELAAVNLRLKNLEGSTIWRATAFLRDSSPLQPAPLRWMRRMMRVLLWTITFQLPSRLAARRQLLRNCQLVRDSELFDPNWYTARYPDVVQAGWEPALHYVLFGAAEQRSPGPGFDSSRYLVEYPDVAAAGINPLVHYLTCGRLEGRRAWDVPATECP